MSITENKLSVIPDNLIGIYCTVFMLYRSVGKSREDAHELAISYCENYL